MEDKQNIRKKLSETGSVNVIYAALVVLGVATALLAWQNWSLQKQISAPAQPVASAPAPQAAIVPPPAAAPPATEPSAPAASVPTPIVTPKRPSAKTLASTAAKRNYTQAPKELPATIEAPAEPAPATQIARVEPTDVAPAALPLVPYPPTESQAPVMPPAPTKISATVPSGTVMTVRLLDTLNTDRNQAGDRFRASLQDAVIIDGNVALPRGTTVEGRIVDAQQAGRVKGVAELSLALSQVRLPSGDTAVIETDTVRRQGETSTGKDATKVGAGSVIGAVIGAVAGGGKGAAIGAATGAGAGTADVLLTRGKPLVLSPETALSFQLNAPVTLQVTPGQQADPNLNQSQSSSSSSDWDRGRPVLKRRAGQ